MHRIDNPSAATNLPTPKPHGPEGYFTAGNPNTGQMATIVEYDWMNTIQEELANIVARGGLTNDKQDNTQLLKALSNLFDQPYALIGTTQNLLVPSWATRIDIIVCAGGGGAAHCQSDGTNYRSGGGAGSGGYAEARRPVTPGQLVNIIIGGGGASETPGSSSSVAFLSNWTVTCTGGQPGLWDAPTNSHGGGGGGATGADMQVGGNCGQDGQAGGQVGFYGIGNGAAGPWGGAPRAGIPDANGHGGPGGGPGAGGGGVYRTVADNTYYPGGVGAPGIVKYRFLP